ncbi:MAG TPA: SNF2-related protein [Planctomycetota bacterium]|nr:SNF2-related protein [Planctomycetota bacterium]
MSGSPPTVTPHQSAYFGHALTLASPAGTVAGLSRSIAGARVDLNPHQVDAALFALRSPLSRGVLLADEVGLGKTIEAGIVISQRWAERHRRVLLVVPATLRKQWEQELAEKFLLPAVVMDSRAFGAAVEAGVANPFEADRLVICSYQFAAAHQAEVALVPWDLVVIDEAHRLRNVYKTSSKIARALVDAIGQRNKLLLTATPLQNSLMELFGLVSVIDPQVFGDVEGFRETFAAEPDELARNAMLRERLAPLCIRTLRKQVQEHIMFTRRLPLTQDFRPGDKEQELYDRVSEYLQRDTLQALATAQRALITLVLRKLLASSTFAIGATLHRLAGRLVREHAGVLKANPPPPPPNGPYMLDGEPPPYDPYPPGLVDDDDLEGVEEIEDELAVTEEGEKPAATPHLAAAIRTEIAELRALADLADRIKVNAKGEALIPALETAFRHAATTGAPRKAVIFTESRRTQRYLIELLNSRGYDGQVLTLSGTNDDPLAREVYARWKAKHAADDAPLSRAVEIKAALVDEFRERATVLVATEAAAEGVNLQFCSLVINYDLPWNPQRVEQRIGRCHRYGQKHDVAVLNFLNRRNEADVLVYELLDQKFKLFDGVFGVSDEVLGALEAGVDIEKRIAQVYQSCRTAEQIREAFAKLRAELDGQIQARLETTRQALLEHVDDEVRARLRTHEAATQRTLDERGRWLLGVTRAEAGADVDVDPERARFRYRGALAPAGDYDLDWRAAERTGAVFYRQEHPLAERLIEAACRRAPPPAELVFDYAAHGSVVSVLKPLVGQSGWLEVSRLTVVALDRQEYLLLAGRTDGGEAVDDETFRKLLLLPAREAGPAPEPRPDLSALREAVLAERLREVDERSRRLVDEEILKLDRWAEDLKAGLERELREIDRQLREARRTATLAPTLAEKLQAQKAVRALETTRSRKRRDLFDAQDKIDARRDELIAGIERQLGQRHEVQGVFLCRWRVA